MNRPSGNTSLLACLIFLVFSGCQKTKIDDHATAGLDVRSTLRAIQCLDGSGAPLDEAPVKSESAVVLEFWATWCAPCVESMRDVNLLASSLGPDVTVLAITDEPIAVVQRFLELHPFGVPTVIDLDGALFKHFAITSRPTMVVLNREGKTVLSGHPKEVGPDQINEALTRGIAFTPRSPETTEVVGGSSPAIYEVFIRNATAPRYGVSSTPNGVQLRWHTASELLAYAYDVSVYRLEMDHELDSYRYDVHISFPAGSANPQEILRSALPIALRFHIEPVRARATCYGLYARRSDFESTGTSTTKIVLNADGIEGVGSITTVSRYLEYEVQRPVVDHTGLRGNYELSLKWKRGDLGSLTKALSDAGFEFVEEEANVDLLRIENALDPVGAPAEGMAHSSARQ